MAGLGLMQAGRVTAQTFTVLRSFSGSDGADPHADLILSGNTLYGTTFGGGTGGVGTIFKINKDGTSFSTLHGFSGSDGTYPQAPLVLSDGTLYGTTYSGGSSGKGTVFAINTNGMGFTNLYNFAGSTDGANTQGPLVFLSNKLYGTTDSNGSYGAGTVFAVNSDGTGFTNLHSFTGATNDGAGPAAGLILSSNTLYGTTQFGGSWNNGTVFAINADGTGFTNLHSFTGGSNGAFPLGKLSVSSNSLYGTTAEFSSLLTGTLFALNTDGTGFRILHSFAQIMGQDLAPPYPFENYDGANPNDLIVSGNKLYGTTSAGGGWGIGTVFELLTDGTGFEGLYTFEYTFPIPPVGPWTTNIDGGPPNGVILSGNTLYGTTSSLGISGDGTVFSISLPPDFATTTNNDTITITQFIGLGGAVIIPDRINGFPVTNIGTNSFSGCTTLTGITIPDSVITIGDSAFNVCIKLANVTIANSLTNIGDMAIGDSAFQSCSEITNITIGNSVASIGNSAFAYCNGLRNVAIPNSVTNIADKAFAFCRNLGIVTIGDQVTDIGSFAFGSTPLTSVTIPTSVNSIGSYAFYDCPLTNLVIPNSVTNIGDSAFEACQSLAGATIGNSVTTIGNQAFEWCTNLTSLTIPASVTNLGNDAFGYCFSLTGIYFNGNAPNVPLTSWTVFDYDSNATVYYLPGTLGWGPTFGGRPTALWTPKVQTSDTSFGVQTNQFGFNINWASGMTVVVEASTSLVNPVWSPVTTNVLSGGTFYFSDPQWTNYPSRFYRVRSQ
jgi:uncharacterized repeat protein (TIGR03803 family)